MKSLCVVLAGGLGTRMKSITPKVLHTISGRPMIEHVVRHVAKAGFGDIAVLCPGSMRRSGVFWRQ